MQDLAGWRGTHTLCAHVSSASWRGRGGGRDLHRRIKEQEHISTRQNSKTCRAVALGGSGAVYVGVNIEFPRVPLNNSVRCRPAPSATPLPPVEAALTDLHASSFRSACLTVLLLRACR